MKENCSTGQKMQPLWVYRLKRSFVSKALRGVVLIALFAGIRPLVCAEPALTEYQIKALCVLNFARYTEWPATAFPESNAPLTVGVVGESEFENDFRAVTNGKSIGGHEIVIREIRPDEAPGNCQILFVSASETKHLAEIMEHAKTKPVLTIGEAEPFLQKGGAIDFVMRNGKIRFDINLDAAHEAGVKISSKVLSLADHVHGNP